MKKFLAVFSLLMLVLLTGCLSDKTERDLTQVPTTEGGTGTANYSFLNSKNVDETLTGSVMEFGYLKSKVSYTSVGGSSFELVPAGELLPYTNVKSVSGSIVDVASELNTMITAVSLSGDTTTITKTATGKINFLVPNKEGTYEKGKIVKGSETYYYYIAYVSITLKENNVDKLYTYVVKSIVKNENASDLLTFENVVLSLNPTLPVSKIDLAKQTELIKELNTLNQNVNYSSDTLKQSVYKAIDDFYIYVEGAYIDSSIASSEKRKKAMEYVKKNSFDYVESSTNTYKVDDVDGTITKLMSKCSTAYRYALEGELANAEVSYNKDEKGIVRTITNLSSLEEKFNDLIEDSIKQDSLQGYIYNKEFWKKVVLSEMRNDDLVQDAIDYIIIGNLEDIRINKLGEGTNPATSGLQPLQNYEEQILKVTKYASYKFYIQSYFLPKNEDVDKQLNIEDYLLIQGAELLKGNTTKLGKKYTAKDVEQQRYINDVFTDAYTNIIKEKVDIVRLANKGYFDKIETAKINGNLSSLDLSSKRDIIQNAIDNLALSVKIYDTDNVFGGSLTLVGLPLSSTYKLTADVVCESIKNTVGATDYQKNIFVIPLAGSKIDLSTLADNIILDSGNIRVDTGVRTALDILAQEENN